MEGFQSTKSWFRALSRKKACPLSFCGWLAYSALASLRRPASLFQLQNVTGLATKTISKVRAELLANGLIKIVKRRLVPLPPPENWFVPKRSKKNGWKEKLAYFRYYRPSSSNPMPRQTVAVYCLLFSYSLTKKRINQRGIATSLKISKSSVWRHLKRIKKYQMKPDDWLDKSHKAKVDVQIKQEVAARICAFSKAGYSAEEVRKINAYRLEHEVLMQLFKAAENENQAAKYENSFHLLDWKIQQYEESRKYAFMPMTIEEALNPTQEDPLIVLKGPDRGRFDYDWLNGRVNYNGSDYRRWEKQYTASHVLAVLETITFGQPVPAAEFEKMLAT